MEMSPGELVDASLEPAFVVSFKTAVGGFKLSFEDNGAGMNWVFIVSVSAIDEGSSSFNPGKTRRVKTIR